MKTLNNPALKTVKLSRFNEHYFPAINHNQFETLDSTSTFKQRFPEFDLTNTLHIIIGLDSGLLANYVMDMSLPSGSKFVFVELEDVTQVLNIDIPYSQQKDIFICHFDQLDNLLEDPILQIYFEKFHCRVSHSIGAVASHLEGYSILKSMVPISLKKASMKLTNILSMQKFMTKQLHNIADNQIAAKSVLSGYDFSSMTCIVVAGGPSLDEQIEWIKYNQNRLFIIAISRVAGKLVNVGITPHIIITIDPLPLSLSVSRGLLPLADRIIMINAYHAAPEIVGQWAGIKCYLGQKLPWVEEDNYHSFGPTVTNTAVNLAITLNFERVLLSGVDLCFSLEGQTHAMGSLEAELNPVMLGHIGQWVETNDGQFAETTIQMYSALESLQVDIVEAKQIQFINLAAQAAKIESVSYQSIETLTCEKLSLSAEDFFSHVKNRYLTLNMKERLQEDRNVVKNYQIKIEKIFQLILHANQLCNQLSLLQKDESKILKLNKQLSRIELKINNAESDVVKLIKTFGYVQFVGFLMVSKSSSILTEHKVEQLSVYYKCFESAIKLLLSYFKDSISRLDCRIQELDPNVPLSTLSNDWLLANQPGRLFIWKAIHGIEDNSDELSQQLLTVFNTLTTSPDKHYQNGVKNRSSLVSVKSKIEFLKSEKHIIGLELMVKNLTPFFERNVADSIPLYWFALSAKYESQGNIIAAQKSILNILPEQRGITELKQIISTSLKMQDLCIALDAFENIALLTDSFMIKHARVLKLAGQVQAAVNVYLDYLDKYPEDAATWLSLGVYMLDINQLDAAKSSFLKSLEIEPDNAFVQECIRNNF
ncbi:MAG: 6-hydroxymethylpterin diphosphokinase MptE-like protein [Shewanella sp.]|uniref:motility associated factor glycosyltransferase family protein n=1 Tax=Shewanella sp. TaxID=50422 RepID=UPI00300288AB